MKHVACFIANYPRPQFVNKDWQDLDGSWDFCFDDNNIGEENNWFIKLPTDRQIIVPFSFQTKASKIEDDKNHDYIWYAKTINVEKEKNKRVILNLEGADYFTKVWINGKFVGSHTGGYTRASFDITNTLKGKTAYVVIKCEDKLEAIQPRGKQTWLDKPFGCWYTRTNGLWKKVWLEKVSDVYLKNVKITPNIDDYFVEFEVTLSEFKPSYNLEIEISYAGKLVNKTKMAMLRRISNIKIDIQNDYDGFRVQYWDNNNPNLFDVKYRLYKDEKLVEEIGSYFGFVNFKAHGNLLLLNNNPAYLKMVLFQGYRRNSGLSIENEEQLIEDLTLIKKLGFNGVRMHQKIEDERFYYYCDIMGILCWCEMPSPYEFKDETIVNLTREWQEVVGQFYNHPSIVCWVPINESWGVPRVVNDYTNQHLQNALYEITKAYDPIRPVIDNDGWEHTRSDIITFHNYAQSGDELAHFYGDLHSLVNDEHKVDFSQSRLAFAKGYKYEGQPIIISEFAGIGYENGNDKGWSYGDKVSSSDNYLNRLDSMIKAIRSIDHVCGFCITQLTDVDSEINGLLDMDRKPKADIEKLKEIISR